ncbi:chorismate mutase [Kiloniella sp. b19]|uniref:chorismate mutase n=1 Tax=Kiloniella sp. GXU_MW_B19 TaxID=3141326 RepID=UPI0031D5265D
MANNKELEKLRGEIDRIDKGIQDLLIERFEVTGQVGALKGDNAVYFRPGREAAMLKNLVSRHKGRMPANVLVRIWREILGCSTRLQGHFAVSALGKDSNQTCLDLAEDHFGRQTVSSRGQTVKTVLRSVSTGETAVGVLPFPGSDEKADEDWWTLVLPRPKDKSHDQANEDIHIVGRLPFCRTAKTPSARQDAVMVATTPVEETGDDQTLLVLETFESLSRSSLRSLMGNSGLETAVIIGECCRDGRCLYLFEVDGFVCYDDDRLKKLVEQNSDRVVRIVSIGSYPRPIIMTSEPLA